MLGKGTCLRRTGEQAPVLSGGGQEWGEKGDGRWGGGGRRGSRRNDVTFKQPIKGN